MPPISEINEHTYFEVWYKHPTDTAFKRDANKFKTENDAIEHMNKMMSGFAYPNYPDFNICVIKIFKVTNTEECIHTYNKITTVTEVQEDD